MRPHRPRAGPGPALPLVALVALVAAVLGCPAPSAERPARRRGETQRRAFERQRRAMVKHQIVRRGVKDPRVLRALRTVPRHRFVPATMRRLAYADRPLPIGHGQTLSQPYIVAYMTEVIRPRPSFRVLEVGTGSGYQAAVLSRVVQHVYSIEIVKPLGLRAQRLLAALGYKNISVRVGDGYQGWPEKAPFDAILLTAAPRRVPAPLLAQLKVGGRLVAPIGTSNQQLVRITRTAKGYQREHLLHVRFVPMTGKALH